jgi:hypothetical protein
MPLLGPVEGSQWQWLLCCANPLVCQSSRSELTSRISTVFHERILPHQPSKLNEIAQNLSITLSNVIYLSFFVAFVSI